MDIILYAFVKAAAVKTPAEFSEAAYNYGGATRQGKPGGVFNASARAHRKMRKGIETDIGDTIKSVKTDYASKARTLKAERAAALKAGTQKDLARASEIGGELKNLKTQRRTAVKGVAPEFAKVKRLLGGTKVLDVGKEFKVPVGSAQTAKTVAKASKWMKPAAGLGLVGLGAYALTRPKQSDTYVY